MKEEMRACGICGKLHPVSELTEFDDTLLCGACLQTETVRCQRSADEEGFSKPTKMPITATGHQHQKRQ